MLVNIIFKEKKVTRYNKKVVQLVTVVALRIQMLGSNLVMHSIFEGFTDEEKSVKWASSGRRGCVRYVHRLPIGAGNVLKKDNPSLYYKGIWIDIIC